MWRSWLKLHARVRKFAGLPRNDRRLLMGAAFWLCVYRLALLAVPFRRLAALGMQQLPKPAPSAGADKIAWAIRVASRYVPQSTCLVQALAARMMLSRVGLSANLHIGVAMAPAKGFQAHAWVELGNKVIIGEDASVEYRPLYALGGTR
jgi:hypothetical protein